MAGQPFYRVTRRKTLVPSQRWGWTLWSGGRKIATSGEGYTSRGEAADMARQVISGGYSHAERKS